MANKLGEGVFGPVYKGELHNKQFVAVKSLSRRSGQGLEEFRNETELIAKLQHRYLVGILGCCIKKDGKIAAVYKYMPNKSLEFLLFDATKKESYWTGRDVFTSSDMGCCCYANNEQTVGRTLSKANQRETKVELCSININMTVSPMEAR